MASVSTSPLSSSAFRPGIGKYPIRSSATKGASLLYPRGLNSFGGLKAHNAVMDLSSPENTHQCFLKVINSLKSPALGRGKYGGALSATCDKAAQIFKIALIINVLTLAGVAFGFVLLRIERYLEESRD